MTVKVGPWTVQKGKIYREQPDGSLREITFDTWRETTRKAGKLPWRK